MTDRALIEKARKVIERATAGGIRIATAESCTGGLVVAALTEIAGSSAVVDRGFVTYSNEAKEAMLGVHHHTLVAHGAVSSETAAEMAEGALAHSVADLSVSVTGIAGPGGGSAEKPVGLVFMAIARRGVPAEVREFRFGDKGRSDIREATVYAALDALLEALPL
jgi:nicotinamide-nucleotide amidase